MEVKLKDLRKFFGVFLLLFLIFAQGGLLAHSDPQLQTELKEIGYQKTDAQLEVSIKIEGQFKYETFGLSDPPRLVIDFWTIQKISALPVFDINQAGVLRIRVGEFKPEVARVVFDLGEKLPSYRISQVEEGLKLVFWLEEGVEKPFLPAKEAPKKPEEEKKGIPWEIQRNYFIQIKSGIGLSPIPSVKAEKDLFLYGESGSLEEEYRLKYNLLFDLSFGRYFKSRGKIIKGGAGFSYWSMKNKGTYKFSLPHPFLANSPRAFTFEETQPNNWFNIYFYGLFSTLKKEKLEIWAGPVIGFSLGKFKSAEDIALEDKAPYSDKDISVSSITYADDSIFAFWGGGMFNFEYFLSPRLVLILDGKLTYSISKIGNLEKSSNLFQFKLGLGIQYSF